MQRIVSLFEREVVWSELSSYVLHFMSPLIDHFLIIGFGAVVFVFICCRVTVSKQQLPPPTRAARVSDGSPVARYTNPRPVVERGRGTLEDYSTESLRKSLQYGEARLGHIFSVCRRHARRVAVLSGSVRWLASAWHAVHSSELWLHRFHGL